MESLLRGIKGQKDKKRRRIYAITPEGVSVLGDAKNKVWELFGDLFHPQQGGP